MISKKLFALCAVVLAGMIFSAASYEPDHQANHNLEKTIREQAWVDSVLQTMNRQERIAQLLWVRANTDWPAERIEALAALVERWQPGGICFFNPTAEGTPEQQVALTNRLQSLMKKVPMLVSIDAEWGIGWRYRHHAIAFPKQMTLGAIEDNTLLYDMGAEIARQCRRMGIHINFAPVADVNNNPANPVINYRSFGENPTLVARKAWYYMRGMQDNGLMACAKHFPGHGDTDVDSHHDLPFIEHSRKRLDSVELLPFKMLAAQGVASIMVAHLHVPALDGTRNLPTTLSAKVVDGILRKQWHYSGLIMTDAMEMQGVVKYFPGGESAARALAAGNDVVLLPLDFEAAMRSVEQWLEQGKLDERRIDASVRRVLTWKFRMGLDRFEPISVEGLREDLNTPQAKALVRKLLRHALTCVRNERELLPFDEKIYQKKLGAVAIGSGADNAFQQRLASYQDFLFFQTRTDIKPEEQRAMLSRLADRDLVVVSIHGMNQRATDDFGLKTSAISFVKRLDEQVPVVLVVFGNPYSLRHFDGISTVLLAYEDDDDARDLAAQALFGASAVKGRLPVTASTSARGGQGVLLPALKRLAYDLPESVGMSSRKLQRINSLVQYFIDNAAMPGCVLLVARHGTVVLEKAWGHHTYEPDAPPTRTSDVFDLASITKIAATTVSLMKLQEEGRFSVREPVAKYLPEFAGSNKADIPMLDLLTHRARLTPWIKFYEATLDEKTMPSPKYYRSSPSVEFPWPVAKDLWLRADYPDTIWRIIRESPLLENPGYRYSDLGFYIAGEVVHRLTGKPVEQYAAERFYLLLGMRSTGYRPYERFPLEQMPPTEDDDYFRHRRIQGYVHDMGAAMLNQATGHAGLFSAAGDLAILMQMLLNKGYYGGRQYLQPETIHFYTSRCGVCTRRGIGFDMRQQLTVPDVNMSALAGPNTFGHLGFTGTAAWADPDNELVFIFLSNRTWPSMFRTEFSRLNVRIRLMDAVYDAIETTPHGAAMAE